MGAISGSSNKPKDQKAWGLIFAKLSNSRKERNRPLAKVETYELISKGRLSGLLDIHFARSKGAILSNAREKITELDKNAPKESGNVLAIQKDFGGGYYLKMKFRSTEIMVYLITD